MTGGPGVGPASAATASASAGASATGPSCPATETAATETAATAPSKATATARNTSVGGAGGSGASGRNDRHHDLVTRLQAGRDLGLPPGCDADLHSGVDGLAVRYLLDVLPSAGCAMQCGGRDKN